MRKIQRTIVAAIIISKDQKVLMGKKDPKAGGVYKKYWHIPGGGMNKNETQLQALRREIKEEVGIDCRNYTVELLDAKAKVQQKKHSLKQTKKSLLKCNFLFTKLEFRIKIAVK